MCNFTPKIRHQTSPAQEEEPSAPVGSMKPMCLPEHFAKRQTGHNYTTVETILQDVTLCWHGNGLLFLSLVLYGAN